MSLPFFAVLRLARHSAALILIFWFGIQIHAQTFDATLLRQPTDLGMTWLVKAGDDPSYSSPALDDSQWVRVDPNLSLKSYFPGKRPEVVWYRLHVKVSPAQLGLGLKEWNLGSAFEIYVNGQQIMAAGQIAPYRPSTFSARLLARIPDSAIETGSLLIALRMHISPNDWVNAFPGLYPYNITIGQESALYNQVWLNVIGGNALKWLYQLVGLGLGIIALALFASQKDHREYLWVFLLFLSSAMQAPFQLYQLLHNGPAWWAYGDAFFQIATLTFQVLTFLGFLRISMPRWIPAWLAVAALGILYGAVQTANGVGSSFSVLSSSVPQLALIAGVIPVLLIANWRRGNREAGILLVPLIFYSLVIYMRVAIFIVSTVPALAVGAMNVQNALLNRTWGPFTLDANSFVGCLFVLSLGVIIVLRSTRIAEQQAHMESQLAAAREVQSILLPELQSVPGFHVETAYEPAQQVGGDFFQLISLGEGSLLLVIGDVAGKGLPAAMMVSVLVGAIRALAGYLNQPAELLAALNRRLVARAGAAFATAMAARIDPDGTVQLANAGHLPPYLDGKEIAIPGALPLGIIAGTEYETVRFQLPVGSRITFYSDGIVEAQNAAGEMFGFERSCGASTEPVKSIIEQAKQYGQQDDMTAIAITRSAEAKPQSWYPGGMTAELGVATS